MIKIKSIVTFLCMSSALYGMDQDIQKALKDNNDTDRRNILQAMQHVLTAKKENEIVICRLCTINKHTQDGKQRWCSSDMSDIVESTIYRIDGVESWTCATPFTPENFKKAQFIVYSIYPSREREHAHPASIRAFKESKKPFIIAIREGGENVVVEDLKKAFPDDTLVFFPPKRGIPKFLVFGIPAAILIGFLCYLNWGK